MSGGGVVVHRVSVLLSAGAEPILGMPVGGSDATLGSERGQRLSSLLFKRAGVQLLFNQVESPVLCLHKVQLDRRAHPVRSTTLRTTACGCAARGGGAGGCVGVKRGERAALVGPHMPPRLIREEELRIGRTRRTQPIRAGGAIARVLPELWAAGTMRVLEVEVRRNAPVVVRCI